ncbi:fumarylacetoacetase [Adhaeribacter pallidiroseus]|uniref:fumarylacetoacetase n=1 Tax=Adhaeribacter pallidiroseus TaxID=2072847 RepID=A0A369QH63_9BACT|nr:fumarylacetoacetase [Adhaeribacter pallidiroseus]RDC63772.1 Fumarylacetoacetase [Adhaeribacter pallidiroseus]
MLRANDPNLHSWIQISATSEFPIQNLPFGIFSVGDQDARVGVAIGDYILDLCVLGQEGLFELLDIDPTVFNRSFLNDFIALGQPIWRAVRERISVLLRNDNSEIRDNDALMHRCLVKQVDAHMHLPVKISNYTDFHTSLESATNVGLLFRDPENGLTPNWKHLPVGYHGRASSIVVSGTPIHRPKGQIKFKNSPLPTFMPTQQLDFELEIGFITGTNTALGTSISTAEAEEHIFGLVLFNDWSARDIQRWEQLPLGPFLGKSFASSISPWVVTLDALDSFRVAGSLQTPAVLPYLEYTGNKHLDINLKVYLQTSPEPSALISQTNTQYLYWTMNQLLAHQTSNGCNIEVGDLYASGTISGSEPDSYGSLLELTWNGSKPILLPNGTIRTYLEDGDTLIFKGYAEHNSVRVGFGELRTKILPAI